MSHIGGVKKDMIILEKSEFSALRSENEVKITILESAILALTYFFSNDVKKHLVPKGLAPGPNMV